MSVELGALTLKELHKLKKDVERAIALAEARNLKEARSAMKQIAREHNISIDDVLSGGTSKSASKTTGKKKKARAKKASTPMYRNPDNAEQTWTGKGRRPTWYVEAIEDGKTEAELAI